MDVNPATTGEQHVGRGDRQRLAVVAGDFERELIGQGPQNVIAALRNIALNRAEILAGHLTVMVDPRIQVVVVEGRLNDVQQVAVHQTPHAGQAHQPAAGALVSDQRLLGRRGKGKVPIPGQGQHAIVAGTHVEFDIVVQAAARVDVRRT